MGDLAGDQRPGQRPQQNTLEWAEAGPSRNSTQGIGVEGDADVRVVSEDKTHRVRILTEATLLLIALQMPFIAFVPEAPNLITSRNLQS